MLTEEKKKELKEKYKDKKLKIQHVGGYDIVYIRPEIKEVSVIRQKQFEIFRDFQQAGGFNPEQADNDEGDIVTDADTKMAEYIWSTVVVFPEKKPDPTIVYHFAESFVERYIFVNLGEPEDL